MAKGERWTKVTGHAASATSDILRNFEQQNDDLRPCLDEKRDDRRDLLSRSFDKTTQYSSSSHDRYFSDIIPDSKQLVTEQFSSFTSNSQSLICSHDGQRVPHSCLDELFLRCNGPSQMTRAGNSSDDSGITADVSYTPCKASCVSLQSSSSNKRQFNHDDVRFSSSKSESSDVTLKMLDLDSLLGAAQMTPGSQRRAFPRTNPNFVTGQQPPIQNTSLLVSQAPNAVTEIDASRGFAMDQECHWQNLSFSNRHFGDSEAFGNAMHNMDEGDGSDRKILRSIPKSSSRQHEDSATRGTSFIFRKLAADQSSPLLFPDETFMSLGVSSSNVYEDGCAAFCASEKSVLGRMNADMQFIVEEDRLEACRRTRRCSEPDYANLRDIALQDEAIVEELDGKKKNSTRKEFSQAQGIQVKEEPIYANEHLTGRGCLTYEDSYHLPTFTGNSTFSVDT